MPKRGGHNFSREAIFVPVVPPHASRGQGFQPFDGHTGGFVMQLDQARITCGQCQDGNTLWSRDDEIIEHTPVGQLQCGQLVSGHWMLVDAQSLERFSAHSLAGVQS